MFGLNPDSSELLRESEWVERLHPEDLAVVRKAMTACLVHQTPYAERFRTVHPDGSIQLVFGIGRPLEGHGEHGHFVGWNFDVMAAGKLAGEWISAHPEALSAEHRFSVLPSPARANEALSDAMPPEALLARAESILRVRHSRERLLGRGMIGEPAFEMILCLYLRSGQEEASLSSLAKHTRIPYSSALRWMAYLADKGFLARTESKYDRRALSVHLTSSGRAVMEEFLAIR